MGRGMVQDGKYLTDPTASSLKSGRREPHSAIPFENYYIYRTKE